MSDCIFCLIGKGEIPAQKVFEDDQVVIFHDVEPAAPVHLLAIPKKHVENLNSVNSDDEKLLGHLQWAIGKIAKDLGFAGQGYRVTSNCGSGAGQAVMHLHYHVMSGRPFSWPPG